MNHKKTPSDILDVDQKTSALIIGKNRLDDYAKKYLNEHCKEALMEPMPIPVEKIIENAGLTIKTASLSSNLDIFGCCMLLDGYVETYDKETREMRETFYPAGTILFDPDSEWAYGEGAKRNTLIHEALHWEKDKKYFQVLELRNKAESEKLYPIMCRQSGMYYEPPEGKKTKANQIKWLEWQAHRLAPRVLMPFDMFKQKALEIIDSWIERDIIPSCDLLIEELSSFFIVSRTSVKYRLIEVGLKNVITGFDDYEELYAEINNITEHIALTPEEAFVLLSQNVILEEWVESRNLIFVDGYFVIPSEKTIRIDSNGDLHLTKTAKKNLSLYTLNIVEHKSVEYKNSAKDLVGYAYMYKLEGIDKRLIAFHPKYQTEIKDEPSKVYEEFAQYIASFDEDAEKELLRLLGDPDTTLCQCLWHSIQKAGWNKGLDLYDNTLVHENYHGRIKNDQYNNMGRDVLIAICVGLKYRSNIVRKVFEKAGLILNEYSDPDKTYLRIIEMMPGLSIREFNSILEKAGVRQLGSAQK